MFGFIFGSFNGPLLLLWRYVVLVAANVGWWVYPFTVILAVSAIVGIFVGLLALTGRVRIGGNREWRSRREIAEKARVLAQDVSELLAEMAAEKQQIWEASTQAMRSGSGPDRSQDAKLQDRISSKFAMKLQNRIFEVSSEARVYVNIERSDFWRIQHGLMSPHMMPEIVIYLNDLAVQLSDGRGQLPFTEKQRA